MRVILACLGMLLLSGCFTKEIQQVEVINAKLVRVDTINRYSNHDRLMLTWKDNYYNLEYVSYASLNEVYVVGTQIQMLKALRR